MRKPLPRCIAYLLISGPFVVNNPQLQSERTQLSMDADIDNEKITELFKKYLGHAIEHHPQETITATLLLYAVMVSNEHETITEAVDDFRSLSPLIEKLIRQVFPMVNDARLETMSDLGIDK